MKPDIENPAPRISARFLYGALILTGIVLVALIWYTLNSYRSATTGHLSDLRMAELRGTIVHLDEVLTMSARLAATTGDSAWERRYRQFESPLDTAIKEAMQLTAHSDNAEAAAQTDAANIKLVEMEDRSFALVRAGKAAEARTVLFADDYEVQKKIYAGGMVALVKLLNDQMAANQRRQENAAIFTIAMMALCVILLFLTWASILAKLKRVHQELLETSRQAGMAEVATSVLHNVGNVLNSVNVAASCVVDNFRKSKAVNLSKVVAMFREHEADLGAFLSRDAKGMQLPGYLAQLADHLAGERLAGLKELAELQKNIGHIKDIVAMQQSFAKVSGVTELLNATDVVNDALRMNSRSLCRHNIHVVREFEATSIISIEKHKVLQILVNLMRNARQSCDEAGSAIKRLTVRVTQGPDQVRIAVTDNGVGIAPENLTRIFSHGFTTKKDGHGFGLHGGALAAKEMGGALLVHSDGVGLGATFTLELPVGRSRTRQTALP